MNLIKKPSEFTQPFIWEQLKAALSTHFDNIKSWADMYDECGMETKKMILSHIMKAVRVNRDYEIEIDLTVDVDIEQLGLLSEEVITTNMPEKKSASRITIFAPVATIAFSNRSSERVSPCSDSSITKTFEQSAPDAISRGLMVSANPSSAV